MNELQFDWTIFKQDGFRFQDMCGDIFRHYNYTVRVMEKGGSDEGRDLELYQDTKIDFSAINEEPFAWVECKSRIPGSSPIKPTDVNINFMYASTKHISYLIFITNHKFNNEAHNLFQTFNYDPKTLIKIRYIEKDELERILTFTPIVYNKYFAAKKRKRKPTLKTTPEIECSVQLNSIFKDDFNSYDIKIKSLDFQKRDIKIQSFNNADILLTLEPLEERLITIMAQDVDFIIEPQIYKQKEIDPFNLIYKNNIPDKLQFKIDHIYVDPLHVKEQIIEEIKTHKHIYIAGNAGKGKSRLLKEISKMIGTPVVNIDLSSDYNKSFLDHFLNSILKIEKEYLAQLPDNIVVNYLNKYSSENNEYTEILLTYIKSKPFGDFSLIVNSFSFLFLNALKNSLILIDNIHKLNLLDFKVFQALLESNHSNKIIFTAREQEIDEIYLKEYLLKLQGEYSLFRFDFQHIPVNTTIARFIDESSSNKDTSSFLSKYQLCENFQEFIFTLKNLRSKKVLHQNENGRLELNLDSKYDKKTRDYLELYNDLISTLSIKIRHHELEALLQIAAVYGYKFPMELIERNFTDHYNILDPLILNEILFYDTNSALTKNIKFDHELTRDIILNSISELKKPFLHRQIINFLEAIGENSPSFSFGDLAHHHSCLNNYSSAALFTNKEAKRLKASSEFESSKLKFEETLYFLKLANENVTPQKDLLELEADTLDNLIWIHFETDIDFSKIFNLIRSLHVLTYLIDSNQYEGIVYFYFSKYYFSCHELEQALSYSEKALSYFAANKGLYYAKVLNIKGVIKKNMGEYSESFKLHFKAIEIFEELNYWEGLSESYADVGASYLESGSSLSTIEWWKKSLEIIKKSSNYAQISSRLVDYSYIIALCKTESIDINIELENSIFLAERLGLSSNVCRACINYSNYLFFNYDNNSSQIKTKIEKAIKLATEIKSDYLLLLAKFSYASFKTKYPGDFALVLDEEIIQHIEKDYLQLNRKTIGDTRIKNILKYYLIRQNKIIDNLVKKSKLEELRMFRKAVANNSINEFEVNNPYFYENLYMTYY